MALEKTILEEGPRNAVVKFTGTLDTSDIALAPAIQLSEFTNNDVRVTLVGLRLDEVEYSFSDAVSAALRWNGNSPQTIITMSGRDTQCFEAIGGLIPDRTRVGYDGAINLTTYGYKAGNTTTVTIIARFVKLYTV